MSSTIKLKVIIFNDGEKYYQWGLYLDARPYDPNDDDNPVDQDSFDDECMDDVSTDDDSIDDDSIDDDSMNEGQNKAGFVDADFGDEDPMDEDLVDEDYVDVDNNEDDTMDEDTSDEDASDYDASDEDASDDETIDDNPSGERLIDGINFIQIRGPLGNQYSKPERVPYNVFQYAIAKMVMCKVDVEDIDCLRQIADGVLIRNDVQEWNSQDHVLSILQLLEEMGIVDVMDPKYQEAKSNLRGLKENEFGALFSSELPLPDSPL